MKSILKILILFFCIQNLAQSHTDFHKAEEYLINNNLDSASFYINKLRETDDKVFLKRILKNDNLTYLDYYQFILNLSKRENVDYKEIANYINREVKEPENLDFLDKNYFNTKWILITKLRDEALLNQASLEQNKLEKYISKFNVQDENYVWASTKIKTHLIVMLLIENEVEKGKKLNLECLEIAKSLNNIELQIVFQHYLTSFLIIEKRLNEYIKVCEKSLELQKKLSKRTFFYYQIINNIINAYIYKGGNNAKVISLINELYNSYSKIYSYALYAQLIEGLDEESKLKHEILEKFEAKNVLELIKKFEILGKDLNANDFYKLLNVCSRALASHNYFKEAIDFKNKAVVLNKKIYSEELSESIANYKTEQAIKIKQKEVDNEKEKTNLYLIIALLSSLLFLIAFLVLNKIKKQSKELNHKNNLINKSLKEKELLVKEMHHRVKNNFQIISSLLELQIKEIEDEKALDLANEGKNRVKSMALIHQKLYQDSSGLIDFDEYLQLLVKELSSVFNSKMKVDTKIDAKNLKFDVDTAIPLGLIINEIITNSYKHAFKTDKKNSLSISIDKTSKQEYRLIIEDNGPGIPKPIEIKKVNSLGLTLVNRLVKQLHGVVNLTNQNGARFEITFKDVIARQLVD